MKMPEKNPDLWVMVAAWLQMNSPSLYAFGLSVVMAVLRTVYGGGCWRCALLEGCICGLVTLALVPLLEWFGLPQSMATFAGGWVGFLGVEKLRVVADKLVMRRVG